MNWLKGSLDQVDIEISTLKPQFIVFCFDAQTVTGKQLSDFFAIEETVIGLY